MPIGTTILIIPSSLAAEAKQDAWIAAVTGVGLGLLFVGLFSLVSRLYPSLSLVQLIEELLGKWLGKAISITFVFFTLVTASELLYYVGTFMTTQIMPETPIQAFNLLFACVVIMGVRLGIETLARSAEFLFPWFVLLFLVLVICVSPKMELKNIQPVLESDFKDILRATAFFIGTFSLPTIVLLMIFPASVNRPSEAQKAFFTGTLVGGIALIIMIAMTILVLGVDITERQIYPSYALAKKINIANFLQRIEIVMAGMWFISIYFKMSCYFYASVVGLAQTLNVKNYRFLVLPMGVLLVSLSLIIHPNIVHSIEFNRMTWLSYASTYGLILPLLLLAASFLRRRGRTISEEEKGVQEKS